MKKAILSVIFIMAVFFTLCQVLKKMADRARNEVDQVNIKVNNNPDKTVDHAKDPATEKKENARDTTIQGNEAIKAYSKYDFVPGEKIIVFEDFMQDAIGDLPGKWNTNSAGETVTIEGKAGHWFMFTKPGVFMPDFVDSLPDYFTLEYDVLADAPVHSWGLTTILADLKNRDKPEDWGDAKNSFVLNMIPGMEGNGTCFYKRVKDGADDASTTIQIDHFKNMTSPVHISIWRQKERIRVYLNQDKTWDVPKAVLPTAKLNSLVFLMELSDKWHFFIGNIRLATGAPDTRNKILTQSKWVTHGILFDVNSAGIKPESYGTLKEMANVMKEMPDLKVKIVGHTDADGDNAANLDLSKRRAAAVKIMLAKEFGIDESRMETDGKGETVPIDTNNTPAGKANNRRVEFIKI